MISKKASGAMTMSTIVVIGFYVLIINNKNILRQDVAIDEPNVPSQTQQSQATSLQVTEADSIPKEPEVATDEPPQTPKVIYNKGEYTAQADFFTPSGTEKFTVTLQIKDDKVAAVSSTFKASHPHSQAINDKLFVPGIAGAVVGKDVDKATLRFAVNGASLHSIAFNDALEAIKKEALRTTHNLSATNDKAS